MEVWLKWYEVWWKSGPDDIAAPQLTPTLLYLLYPRLSRSAEAPLPRRGLSTTSPLRGSVAVTSIYILLSITPALHPSYHTSCLGATEWRCSGKPAPTAGSRGVGETKKGDRAAELRCCLMDTCRRYDGGEDASAPYSHPLVLMFINVF